MRIAGLAIPHPLAPFFGMKTHTRNLLIWAVIFMGYLSTSCGRREARLPIELPDRMVPVEQTAAESVVREEQAEISVDAFFDPTREKVPFTLAQEALLLGLMSEKDYLTVQQQWVGSRYPACNFFLISALCESEYCRKSKPFYKAAAFDLYFLQSGWKAVSLSELKELFRAKKKFDAVFQKPGITASRPGHVMVAVGLDGESGQIEVAEGSLGTISHQVETITDRYIESWNGGFRIFVNQPEVE
jgi:hypothetical protein